jgi:hypothetical protein
MVAQLAERLVHVDAHAFGEHAFGLLDDDSAGEGVAELFVDDLGLDRGAVLEHGDGRVLTTPRPRRCARSPCRASWPSRSAATHATRR